MRMDNGKVVINAQRKVNGEWVSIDIDEIDWETINEIHVKGKYHFARNHWIPCKTALPEKGQYVLCQCRAGIMDVLHLTDDNGWYKDSTHIYMHGFVLAWMPLPEPYEGRQDE